MNLHDNREAFRELVELTADYFAYQHSHIEKEYWVCKILQELAFSNFSDSIFFKGGTSLSKGYGLINRFSEDLDLFVYTGNPAASKQAEKTLNRNVSHFIIENNKEIYKGELSKTGGDFRKLVFSFDTYYKSDILKENLEVEIKCCTLEDKSKMYYPAQKLRMQPMIAEYLQVAGRSDLIVGFDIGYFDFQTIDPKRTLCDKISRLTKLSYEDDFEILIAKHIRDVYDIYCILDAFEYFDFIQSDEFLDAMRNVTSEDGLNRNIQSISKARIFAETELVLKLPNVLRAYNNELRQLMFEPDLLPSLDKVIRKINLLYPYLCRFDDMYHPCFNPQYERRR